MIGRIGFRRLLPILFTLMHVALLLYASVQPQPPLSVIPSESAYHSVVFQENSVKWELTERKPLTSAQKLATLLNLPALVLAIPIALVLFRGNDMGALYGAVPFVPLVWYGVGRWLDGLLGYIGRSHVVTAGWSGLFAVLSTGLFTLSVLTVTPINHHRTTDTYWVGTALVLWSGLFVAICLSNFYRHSSS